MLIILSGILLVACGTREVKPPEKVNVPVYMVPAPPKIERPELPIHSILSQENFVSNTVSGKNTGELAKAYVVSLRLAMNWGLALERIVYAYEKMSKRDFSLTPLEFEGGRVLAEAPMAFGASLPVESENDFGPVKLFADEEFSRIIDKYEYNKELILEDYYNETESDQEPE